MLLVTLLFITASLGAQRRQVVLFDNHGTGSAWFSSLLNLSPNVSIAYDALSSTRSQSPSKWAAAIDNVLQTGRSVSIPLCRAELCLREDVLEELSEVFEKYNETKFFFLTRANYGLWAITIIGLAFKHHHALHANTIGLSKTLRQHRNVQFKFKMSAFDLLSMVQTLRLNEQLSIRAINMMKLNATRIYFEDIQKNHTEKMDEIARLLSIPSFAKLLPRQEYSLHSVPNHPELLVQKWNSTLAEIHKENPCVAAMFHLPEPLTKRPTCTLDWPGIEACTIKGEEFNPRTTIVRRWNCYKRIPGAKADPMKGLHSNVTCKGFCKFQTRETPFERKPRYLPFEHEIYGHV